MNARATILLCASVAACRMGSDSLDPFAVCCDAGRVTGDGATDGDHDEDDALGTGAFALRADDDLPCVRAGGSIDVNLGTTPARAVRSLHCQITGEEPSTELLTTWSTALSERDYVRRIDVARSLCTAHGRACSFVFSDPWQQQVERTARCVRRTERDLGAVLMFFSACPSGVNCDMLWASSHALGMKSPHAAYGFGAQRTGYYHPDNPGFWRRELLDARWAGLSFLLLNTYGPDLGSLRQAARALDDIEGGIGVALMDDTWTWGRSSVSPWDRVPDLADTEAAARAIYESKWRPFFQAIPARHWYMFRGRPLVYFYNAGTLEPRRAAPAVIRRVKERFAADFGVTPFVAVDAAFFEDEVAMNAVADARFTWDTFRFGASSSELAGVRLDHAMVRWDAVGRDRPGEVANESDRIHKGPELLASFLDQSRDADLAVVATWNDLGEGTGVHRNYDYVHRGDFLAPDHFLSLMRAAQCDGSSN